MKNSENNLNGFLLINKPLTWTSFDVIGYSRKILQTKKIGHTGTLDPLATGLMILGIGKGTKFLNFHTADKKTYEADVKFGFKTETFDDEGEKIPTDFEGEISKQKLFEELENFKGKIKQIPPRFSAIKVGGKKLCNLARKGQKSVKIPEREITIFEIKILEYKWPDLKLKITCSSGTYIRSIANDLGENLGCGGYLTGLKRTEIEDLKLENAIETDEISEEKILPLDKFLNFEKLFLDEKILERMGFGQKISLEKLKLEKNFLERNKKFLSYYNSHIPTSSSNISSCHSRTSSCHSREGGNPELEGEKFFMIYDKKEKFIGIGVLFNGILKSKVFI